MKSPEEKNKQKELLKDYKLKAKQSFVASLPFPKEYFTDLFDFLNEALENEGCDHTLKLTEEYLRTKGIYSESAVGFFQENDGFCDCEVLSNVEEKFEGL